MSVFVFTLFSKIIMQQQFNDILKQVLILQCTSDFRCLKLLRHDCLDLKGKLLVRIFKLLAVARLDSEKRVSSY